MACFLVPAAEAVVTTIAAKVMKSKEVTPETVKVQIDGEGLVEAEKLSLSKKLGWLNKLLWGGSGLLAFEHVWHGEVVTMAVLVTAVWAGMLAVSSVIEKKAQKALPAKN